MSEGKKVEGEKGAEQKEGAMERSAADINLSRKFAEQLMAVHERDVRAGKKEHTASFDRIDPGKQEDFVQLFLDARVSNDLRTFIGELGKGSKRFQAMVEKQIGGSTRAEDWSQPAVQRVETKKPQTFEDDEEVMNFINNLERKNQEGKQAA